MPPTPIKPPRGRPSQGTGVLIQAMVTPLEARFIREAAENLGYTRSEFARAMLMYGIYQFCDAKEEDHAKSAG